jgi:hypothetical protein
MLPTYLLHFFLPCDMMFNAFQCHGNTENQAALHIPNHPIYVVLLMPLRFIFDNANDLVGGFVITSVSGN